jgi:hypothetical protein
MRISRGVLSLAVFLACNTGRIEDMITPAVTLSFSDADGDNIRDIDEAGFGRAFAADAEEGAQPGYLTLDSDGDGIPNYQDTDSDGDTIADALEAGDVDPASLPVDTDGDGTPDFMDQDSDGNCLRDDIEGQTDVDEDGLIDAVDVDNDGDSIFDLDEVGAACGPADTDADGVPDINDQDSDGDGILDFWEAGTSAYSRSSADTDGDGVPDFQDDDSDGDGFLDAAEAGRLAADGEPTDSDGDGTYDFQDVDRDGDGLSDFDEANTHGTNPDKVDTDGDGFRDGAEVVAGSDPMDGASVVEGLYVIVPERHEVAAPFEFQLSVKMGDVAFLLDTTGSMSSTLNAMANEFSSIVSEVEAIIPDAEYGVARFDDYAYGSMGSTWSDKPFKLEYRVTRNVGAIQTTLSGLDLHGGADGPESAVEAIYQTLTGAGYDQNCNGSYDTSTDVPPFLARPEDPFAGTGGQGLSALHSGTGQGGGMGFREFALPIVVYATDNDMRGAGTHETPGGCPDDASTAMVATASEAIGAKLIGVCVQNCAGQKGDMTALAELTNSYADLDGDGASDDLLVLDWSGSSADFRSKVTSAVEDLVETVRFETVKLAIEGDDHGFVVGIEPAVYYPDTTITGERIEFTLSFRGSVTAQAEDQVFVLKLNVLGDDVVLLDTRTILVLVPGADS